MDRKRVAIWSVAEEYHSAYSVLLLSLWSIGTIYHAWLRFVESPRETLYLTIHEFVIDIGVVGLSSAVLALMAIAIVAGVKAIMVLFDWPTKAKVAAKARREGRKELRQELRQELLIALSERKEGESAEEVIQRVFSKDLDNDPE